ncbi:MAG: F0F1 ATP synthase subunit epsilon [Rhodospirillaceae bacterium]|nr:F0F1 ATP synthase subunit epsilon [Rhodospirillaceae bacterium]
MADTLSFELVSPERLLLSREVEMVVVPGTEGDFGVLPSHAPLISQVRPGILVVFDGGKPTDRIFVSGGVAEVTPERCTVLAEEAMPVEALDRADAERQIADGKDDLAEARSDLERGKAERSIEIGEAKLAALAGGSPY